MKSKPLLTTVIVLISTFTFGQDTTHKGTLQLQQSPVETGKTRELLVFALSGKYDMTGSAQNLTSISRLVGRGLDNIVNTKDTATGLYKTKGLGKRIIIGFLANFIFVNWLSTIQHEYMGHGYRIRENRAPVNRYVIPPAIFADAYVDFDRANMNYYGKILYAAGGSESNTVFARESFRQNLLHDYFFQYNIHTMMLKLDMPAYILGGDTPSPGTSAYDASEFDVVYYIKSFAAKSGTTQMKIYQKAKQGAYWSLADPSMWLSLLNYTRDYLVKGYTQIKNPMIHIRSVGFLPFTDFHLSPFGYEYYAGSYFRHGKNLLEANYRWSNGNVDGRSKGFGFNLLNAYQSNRLRFDAGADVWKQDIDIRYYQKDTAKYSKKIRSGKIRIASFYRFSNTTAAFGQVSYKGDGYLLGNPLKKGFNLKLGASFIF